MAMRTFDVEALGAGDLAALSGELLPDERIEAGYRGERATILFTNLRIVTVQLQVVIAERIETTSFSYRAVRSFSSNRGVAGEGRSEFRIAIEGEPHPLHLRASGSANAGADFLPLQALLAARMR